MTDTIDWRHPDYDRVLAERAARLTWLREHPEQLPALKAHYAEHPADFVTDWALTSDPRNRNKGLPVELPFVLFPRQRELLDFILACMRDRVPGVVEKSRDCGASWLSVCLAATLCLFNRGVVVGFGSNKADRVDRSGDPDSLFWKLRFFLNHLPPEFRAGWDESRNSAYMRVVFPDTGSAIVGESSDGIGRGGRSSLFIIDEAAHLEHPQLIEASLASNTDCRIDISTPCGRANAFAVKRHSGRVPVFTFGWRDDPRKDDAWYARQCELLDSVTRAQEIDLSYDASVEGILIPSEWVHAAIGAHTKLGIEVTGARFAGLDVADEGRARNAFAGRRGILLEHLISWPGKGSDIYRTTVKAIGLCDQHGYQSFAFDSDGIGGGVRGDAVDINAKRREARKPEIEGEPFRGSGSVFDPDGSLVEARLNRDYFQNLKSQSWWALRLRFQATWRAVVEGMPYSPDDLISIDPELPELQQLLTQLTQPTFSLSAVGKITVDKIPDGAASPDLADAVMICYSPFRAGAYFASAPSAAASAAKVPAMPTMDYAYACVSFVENVAAVVHVAANRPDGDGTPGSAFYVLDWDLRVLDARAEAWMWGVAARLQELYAALAGRARWPLRVFCDDFDQGYAELLRQAGFPAVPVGKDLPPVGERFNLARPYVNVGLVSLAQPAQERVVTFRGTARNYLRELLGQSEVTPESPLALAFATAVLMTYRGRPVVSLPKPVAPEAWSPHDFSGTPAVLRPGGIRVL